MPNLLQTLRYITSHPINQKNRWAAIRDFVRWQAGSRLLKLPVLFDWIQGTKLVVENGEAGLTGNVYTGLHEFVDMAFVLHCLGPNDLFVDIGSNRGSYTVLASGVNRCKSVAIEPIPETFRKLLLNVRINDLENLAECHNLGLAESSGTLRFSTSKDSMNHVASASEVGEVVEVPVSTLDELLDGRSPLIMKIDVEGYELPVLRGASKTLSNHQLLAIIIEINDSSNRYGFGNDQVAELLKSYGFLPCQYDPWERNLNFIDGFSKNSCNTIFAKDPQLATRMAKSGKSFKIRGCSI